MATQLEKLVKALKGYGQQTMPSQQPSPATQEAPQMGGMSGQAQGMIQMRPQYLQYAEQAMTEGKQPVSFEQFVQGAR